MDQPGSAIVVGVGPERGLGAALATYFAEKGLHVFIVGRSEEKLNHVVQLIQKVGVRFQNSSPPFSLFLAP